MRYRVKVTEAPELFKVKLVEPPKAKTGYQIEGSLANDLSAFGGGNLKLKEPDAVSRTTITKVPREEANLEAEGGETVLTFDPSGYPLFYEIKGPRHSANGVPLNLPDDSFIFSDTKSMMIKDPAILKMFNKAPKKGGYTPADLSKQFLSINKYRMTLQNQDSDKIDVKTAELMIKKALVKLGALALAQEAKKGFPQGIPAVAKPYMEANGISEQDILPDQPQQESPEQEGQAIDMGQAMAEGAPEQAMEANEPAPTMPDGSPVAMPEEMEGAPEGLPPAPGMRYGGRTLRKAAEGLAAALGRITQRVQVAMEAGQPLEDILIGLLKNDVTPVDILDVLSNLGIPENKGKELVTQALTDYQQMAQQQQAAPQQGQPSQEEMMAMAQQMPQEQMEQAPMAQYGMSMGGFYPAYAFGGMMDSYDKGGQKKKSKEQLQKEINEKKYKDKTQKVKKFDEDVQVFEVDGKKIGARGTLGGGEREYKKEGKIGKGDVRNFDKAKWEASICNRLKKGATVDEIAYAHGLNKEVIKSKWANCIKEGQEKYGEDTTQFFELEEDCPCMDAQGKAIEGKFAQKDENGKCLPETCNETTITTEEEECVCIDPVTKQESVFPKNPDGTCPPCTAYEMEQKQQLQKPWSGSAELPEDKLNLGIALASKPVNIPPVMGKAPGVRENAWGTDYMGQAELLKGMTAATQSNIGKVAANNPAGAVAAMIAAGRGAQGDIINLASQTNADNAQRATQLNKANTAHQWNQLLLDKENSDIYNQRNATWHNNKAQDNANYWANVGDKYATMKGNERMLKAVNASTGMKWDPVANDYVNTNTKVITPEKPGEGFEDKLAKYKKMGLSSNQDALKAMELEMRMNKLNNTKLGGVAFAKGGYVYADIMYPFIL
jgi:hypothetical protein